MMKRSATLGLGFCVSFLAACEPPQTIVVNPAPVPPPAPIAEIQTVPAAPPQPVYDPNYVNPVEDPSIFDSGEPELIELPPPPAA